MQTSLFSIDFDPVFEILTRHHLFIYPKFYSHFLNRLQNEFTTMNESYFDMILKPPVKVNWPNRGLVDYDNEYLKIYEETCFYYYDSKKWTPKRVALAYIDLIPACEIMFEKSVCYLNSAFWFLKELVERKSVLNEKERYAVKELIFFALYLAEWFVFIQSDSPLQYYICKLSLMIEIYTHRFCRLTKDNFKQILVSFKRVLVAQKYIPIFDPPLVMVFEAGIFQYIYKKTLPTFLKKMKELEEEDRFLKNSELFYKIYEKSLFDSSVTAEEVEEFKLLSMDYMLEENKSEWEETIMLMNPSYLNIDEDGWFVNQKKFCGSLNKKTFYNFRGIELLLESGKINLFASKPSWLLGENGNFSWYDVETALSMNEEDLPIYFSLDQPDNKEAKYHPFQKFTYNPPCLKNTDFLSTLFHTDYLMKMWSIGVEINRKMPFKQRPVNLNSIFSNVPEQFANQVLKSTQERGEESRVAHRFWIQAESIDYQLVKTEKKIQIYVGDVKMCVKTHEQVHDNYGNLVDSSDEVDPNSPAALFAEDLTKNFDKICSFYPEFERLRSLCKLQVIPRYLTNELLKNLESEFARLSKQTTYNKDQEKIIEGYRVAEKNLSGFLRKYRNNRPKVERSSYELVPAVLHKSETKNIISTIYGGVSFNCKLTENKNLKGQKILENRHEVNVTSERRVQTPSTKNIPKNSPDCTDKGGKLSWRFAEENLGPSKKPKLHFVQLNSRKDAQEAARRAGKGK